MDVEYRKLSKIFNSSVLNDIAVGDFSYIQKVSEQFFSDCTTLNLSEIYQKSFEILQKHYPNEYVYKNLIATKILLGRHSLNTATMLSEFRAGTNKADCVILNGKSICYEIKTDYDSLIRLNDQLDAYTQIFDEVYVVCSKKHIDSVLKNVDSSIGVLNLSEKSTFQEIRKANNPREKNKKLLIQSLRQSEYLELFEKLTGNKLVAPNTQMFDLCLDALDSFQDEKTLNSFYIEILKKSRKNNKDFLMNMPTSLVNATISYKFSKSQILSLINNFNIKEEIHVLSNFKGKT